MTLNAAQEYFHDAAQKPLIARQDDGENTALPLARFDAQTAAVAVDDMLDDGQAQPGAANGAAAMGVDTVEALGQARDMQRVDPFALIDDIDNDHRAMHRAHALLPTDGKRHGLAAPPVFQRILG